VDTIRVGLIGLGGMAGSHVEKMRLVNGMRVTAICDTDVEKVAAWGTRLGIANHNRFTSFQELAAHSEVDAVVAATPNSAHYSIVEACLRARKPLMAEKPFTRTYEEAKQLKALAQAENVDCFVGFSYRYVPSFRMAREWIREGKLGAVRHVFIQYLQDWGVPLFQTPMNWRWDAAVTGTGVLHDLGSHMIDAARFIVGEPVAVSGMLRNLVSERPGSAGEKVHTDIDDFAAFTALLENDTSAVFQTSRNAFGCGNQFEVSIYGDLGSLHFGWERGDILTWVHLDGETGSKVKVEINVPDIYKLEQLQDFADFVRGGGGEATPTLRDGYRNQLALEAVIRSDQWGRKVSLSEIEQE
jgi:predicted dehydrogenase